MYGLAVLVLPIAWMVILGRGGRLQSAKLRMRPGPWSSKKWRWPFLGLVVLQSLTNMLFFIMPTQLPFLASEFPGASKHQTKGADHEDRDQPELQGPVP